MASRKPASRGPAKKKAAAPAAKKKAAAKRKSPAKRAGAVSPRSTVKSGKAPAKKKVAARKRAKAKTKVAAKTRAVAGTTRRKRAVNRRDSGARKRKRQAAERPVLAFMGEAARWTVSPLYSPSFRAMARLFIGIALFPLGWITLETFLRTFGHVALEGAFWKTSELWFFGIGAVLWLVLFFGLRGPKMMVTYVAGHEWTHAFFVLLSGGNVKDVHISASGGHILTNKNNLMIVLSPYFVPFYTVVAIFLWGIITKIAPEWAGQRGEVLFAVIGFTWCFHISFTIWMITREQPDLHHYGRTFSIALIVLVNTMLISAMLILASPDVTTMEFARAWWYNCSTFGSRLVESLYEIVTFFV